MALFGLRYLSGTPQWQWIVLCLLLFFAFMTYGARQAIEAPSDLAAVQMQIGDVHLLGEEHSDGHACNPDGDREGKDCNQYNCTFGPGCSFAAVISETAASAASFKLSPFQARMLPPVSSEAVSHFRPPRSSASA